MDFTLPMDVLQSIDEGYMPDEAKALTATSADDSLGHAYSTGYTVAETSPCRWQELTGREAEVARALTPDATHYIYRPLDTHADIGQRIKVFQDNALVLTATVLAIKTGSYGTSIRLTCQEVPE